MKIAYLSSSTLPSTQANSVHVMKMCSALASEGHNVTLVGQQGHTKKNSSIWSNYGVNSNFGIKFVKRFAGKLGSVLYGAGVAWYLTSLKPTLLYGRCPHSLFFSCGLGISFIYEAHSLPGNQFRYGLERLLFLNPNFKRLIVISNALKQAYLEKFSVLKGKDIVVAHDGADVSNVPGGCRTRNNKSAKLKVGYVGSLYPGKGMEVIARLARTAPEYEYHVVGANGLFDKWRQELEERVIFHGQVQAALVPELMQSFDILLLPPQNKVETAQGGDIARFMSPLKMFEYMSASRPIVASDLPVIREVLVHEHSALLVDPRDILGWCAALRRISDDPLLAEKMSKNAYETLLRSYSWRVRAKLVIPLL
ncbi:glycosyltransferase family 4 protein [Exilibacterium tricleocarpae]|uniref:Glycosyltransferase family 4 protein n=1 Tax=Exilibacterium tricleocarpae TaxID=2591008 RepID=A0A545U440_9GAMM|nr:glycosyltransferase family 4 protein [Exilibacterium tricleocarpae]TQV84230.1 glycosyltransferase family 4 protein [Exilibacterium tricleocarpae]